MESKTQFTTKYPGVYVDSKGNFFYQTEFGTDKITGKRIRKKGRRDANGRPFSSAAEANRELTRLKNEYYKVNSYSNYRMKYGDFMKNVYIPYYKTEVESNTFETKMNAFSIAMERFGDKALREISIEDAQNFRTWLLLSINDGGNGYSKSYASLIFGAFRSTLDKAVDMQYLECNVSRKLKSIGKGKTEVAYWTKMEFEKVINLINISDFYEHLCFTMIWVYFMTGVRVNEGTALHWDNVDFKNRKMQVHHMLDIKSKSEWKRKAYIKTESGKRTITLDDDTINILKIWRNRQKEINLGHGDDFIFTYDGLPMIKSTISRFLERYAKKANVKRIQAKGLRHSHASYLINEFNASVLVVSQRMGHSSPEITLKHYSHMWCGADVEIANAMSGNVDCKLLKSI